MSERDLQKACFSWFTMQYPDRLLDFAHIANERKQHPWQGVEFRRRGVLRGHPDIHISVPTSQHHGFYIELKYGYNKLTKEQKQFFERKESQGYKCSVIYSLDDFILQVQDYLA